MHILLNYIFFNRKHWPNMIRTFVRISIGPSTCAHTKCCHGIPVPSMQIPIRSVSHNPHCFPCAKHKSPPHIYIHTHTRPRAQISLIIKIHSPLVTYRLSLDSSPGQNYRLAGGAREEGQHHLAVLRCERPGVVHLVVSTWPTFSLDPTYRTTTVLYVW